MPAPTPGFSSIADLANDVYGIRLGLIDINKVPTAQQQARVARVYAQKYAELDRIDKAYWDQASIPDLVIGALSRIIAAELAPGHGMDVPTEVDNSDAGPESIGTVGWRMLNRYLMRESSDEPAHAEYF